MKGRNPYLSTLLSVLMLSSSQLAGAQEALLDQAFNYLEHGDSKNAWNLVSQYLGANPRRYRADFLAAVAACQINRGEAGAMQMIAAVKSDYILTADAERQVNRWITYCAGASASHGAPQRGTSGGEGYDASAVSQEPAVPSASADLSSASAQAEEPALR
jgi:thioredoxin-like negative regulator of GroEL